MHLISYVHFFGITVSMLAFVYTQILIKPEHLLGGWWRWVRAKLTRIEKKDIIGLDEEKNQIIVGTIDEEHEHWLLKPLGGCIYCTGGQMALWLYFFHYITIDFLRISRIEGYDVWHHVFAVAATIFYCHVWMKLFK